MKRIGLIAGNGKFPIFFSKAAVSEGYAVYGVAHLDETEKEIENHLKEIKWIKVGQLGKIIDFFHKHHIKKAVMAGGIKKTKLFTNVMPDLKGIKVLAKIKNKNDDAILRGIADALYEEGIELVNGADFVPAVLAVKGILTKRKPSQDEMKDIEFGIKMCKGIGALDIGQCVVVKNQAVLAVEAIEGTDETIKRGAEYGKDGAVVVKLSKPSQDMRFDQPTIGIETIKTMNNHGAAAIAVEAGKTIMIDKEELVNLADKLKITIVGV